MIIHASKQVARFQYDISINSSVSFYLIYLPTYLIYPLLHVCNIHVYIFLNLKTLIDDKALAIFNIFLQWFTLSIFYLLQYKCIIESPIYVQNITSL